MRNACSANACSDTTPNITVFDRHTCAIHFTDNMDILKKIINMYAEPVSRIISIRISNIQKKNRVCVSCFISLSDWSAKRKCDQV